ncbi:MAG: extracellular solute-binding protein [Treponema sp.]|jgi:ABC-type glycerol-3-phosphate transport system substrate-binding protein|nr:extracellular solute-binding protein [Treponema sp.]
MKKIVCMVLAVLLAVSSVFGGGKKDSVSGPFVPPVEYGIRLDKINLDNSLHGQYSGKKLVVMTTGGDQELAVRAASVLFEQLSGAKVEVQVFPWDDLNQKIINGLNSSGDLDCIVMAAPFVTGYEKAGLLADMGALYRQHGAAGYDMDDFIPAMMDSMCRLNGKVYAVPCKPDAYILSYRKDILEDPAVRTRFKQKTGHDLKVPETMEEMKRTADYFTKSKNPDSPVLYGYATQGSKGNSRWIWSGRLGALGGGIVDLTTMEPAFDNEAGIKAMQFALSLVPDTPPEFMQLAYDELNLIYTSGDVFMAEQWPGLATATRGTVTEGKTGFAVMPGQSPVIGGWTAAIAKNSRQQELAWKFVELMTSKDGEIVKIKHTFDPCRLSNYQRSGIKDLSPMYPVLLKSLQVGAVLPDVPVPYIGLKLNDVCEKWMQSALAGKVSPEAAIKGMADEFRAEIRAAGLQ